MKSEGFAVAKVKGDGSTVFLPRGAVTQKFAFIGKSGSGKTYAAGKLIEELYDRGLQIIIVDPVGNWAGIRVPGTGQGLEIPVLGGLHGDLPLHPESGETVAAYLAKFKMSAVVDVSQFTGGEQRRFVEAFARSFFETKKSHKSPVMIFWEECQVFIPQKVAPSEAPMVGALEKLIKIGRNYGVGTALLSQRPQSVNKDALNLTECFICFQLTAPHERKAVGEWMSYAGVGIGNKSESEMNKIPELQPGEAFIWSPSWLKMRSMVKFLPKRSSDFSKTPDWDDADGDVVIAPIKAMSQAMLDGLRTTIEAHEHAQVEKGNTKALKKRVVELEAALTESHRSVKVLQEREIAPPVQQVYVPVVTGDDMQRIAGFAALMDNHVRDLVALGMSLSTSLTKIVETHTQKTASTLPPAVQALTDIVRREDAKDNGAGAALMNGRYGYDRVPKEKVTKPPGGIFVRGEWAILTVAIAHYPNPCSLEYLAVATGFTLAGGFRNYITKLKNGGYLDRVSSSAGYVATEKAKALHLQTKSGEKPTVPRSKEILEMWITKKLVGKEKNILQAFYNARGQSVTLEKMAEIVGMQLAGGFRNYITKLKNNHLITKGIGGYRLSEFLVN